MDEVKVYIEEAEDLILKMEQSLLELEHTPGESSLISEIFRSMHTLKGNSGMFGLPVVADFVHNLETLYDKVRNDEMELTKEVADCTFSAIDHLKSIIYDNELAEGDNKKKHADLTNTILRILVPGESIESADTGMDSEAPESPKATYHIYFNPGKNTFEDGTNPFFIIDEITSLGKTRVFVHINAVKSIDDFNPEQCYTFWDVLLVTEAGENAIRDIFLFVEDNSEIEINLLYQGDLISNREFNRKIPGKNLSPERISLDSLKHLVEETDLSETPVNKMQNKSVLEKEVEVQDLSTESDGKKSSTIEKVVSSIRVPSDKLDELMNQVSELVTTQASLTLYAQKKHDPDIEAISENVDKLSRQLRNIAFAMTLIPINNLFDRFQRMVRDVSLNLGKSVNFVTEGGETELDKTIIESLTDPLLHLIRNSLDHGIESKESRLKKGKPGIGTIKLKSYYSGAKVYIQIEDDGSGIDTEIIRDKAVEKGLITKDEELSEREIYDLLFVAGFSTAKNVTDVSGRGVGMDVVKRNISDIRGEINVESKLGEGTKITLGLPLTLSIIDGLLIKMHETHFVIPLAVVSKCHEITKDKLSDDFNQLLVLDGEQVPFLNLRDEFEAGDENASDIVRVIVVHNEESKIGICVDSIVGNYQAVLKPVGKYYRDQEFVSGATILGDGTIALVLDTNKIIELKVINKTLAV